MRITRERKLSEIQLVLFSESRLSQVQVCLQGLKVFFQKWLSKVAFKRKLSYVSWA